MKTIKSFMAIASIASLCFTSCESMLEVSEKSTVPREVALGSLNGQESVLLHCYHTLQGSGMYGRTMTIEGDVLADLVYITSVNSNRYVTDSNNTPGSDFGNYATEYNIIVKTNEILTSIDDVDLFGESPNRRDLIKGEAYFMRAFAYFDLARVYGYEPAKVVEKGWDLCVPTSTIPFHYEGGPIPEELSLPRNSVSEVYSLIEQDLNNAFRLLENNPMDTQGPWRATKYTVKSLLARLYLYWEKYPEAVEAASYVINNSGVKLHSGNYRDVFSQSLEAIFGLWYNTTECLTYDSMQSICSRPDTGNRNDEGVETPIHDSGYGDIAINPDLVASYENGDSRRVLFRLARKGTQDVWWTDKYGGFNGLFGLDNINIIRIAELYTIRAEAYASLPSPNISAAMADVNALRISRQLSAIDDTSLTAQEVLDMVEAECKKEFICEGHRWFDLKRKDKQFVKGTNTGTNGALFTGDYRWLGRIPIAQVDINPNLKQNPGY